MATTGGSASKKLNFQADQWVAEAAKAAAGIALRKLKDTGALQRLADTIARDVDRQIARIMPVVAGKLVGQRSSPQQALEVRAPADDPDDPAGLDDGVTASFRPYFRFNTELHVEEFARRKLALRRALVNADVIATWAPLSYATVKEKRNSLYLVRTGELRARLQAFDLLSKVGNTKVVVNLRDNPRLGKIRGTSIIGNLDITIFPRLPAAQRAALLTDEYQPDRSFGLEGALFGYSSVMRKKLKGATDLPGAYGGFRPLLGPVLNWYVENKLPLVIGRVVSRLPAAKDVY